MPAGISYVPGSVTGATELSTTSNTVSLDVTTAGTVTYEHTASCTVDETATFTDQASLNGGAAFVSNAYNVAEAALQTTAITNSPQTANVGATVIRTASITNGGIGVAREWYYQEIVPTGAYIFDLNSITYGGVAFPAANASVTSGGGFDTLTLQFTGSLMTAIGNNDQDFDGNYGGGTPESFNIVYNAVPLDCGGGGYALNSAHRVFYGCGDLCSDVSFSSSLDIAIAPPPNLAITHTMTLPSCLNGITVVPGTLTITNTGGPTTDFVAEFGNYYTYASTAGYGYPSAIDTATFKYSINGGPLQTPVFTSVYTNAGYAWFGNTPCGLENSVGQFTFSIPVIPAGATVTFNYDFNICCTGSQACPAGESSYMELYQNQLYIRTGSYKNACGDLNYNIPAIYFNYNGMSHNTVLSYPSDLSDNQVANYATNIVASSAMTEGPGAYYEIITILPAGFTQTSTAPNLEYGGLLWPGTTIISGDSVISRFYKANLPGGFDVSACKYNLELLFSCASYAGAATIRQKHFYVQDSTCTCKRALTCVSNTPLIHCPAPCPEGINNLFASANRANFGQPDTNNDGLADVGAAYDLSKMNLKNVMYGDTVAYTYGGVVNWITANGPLTNYYAETYIQNATNKFVAVGSQVSLYRNGILISGPTAYPNTFASDYLVTDFSAIAPSIQQGDSIVTTSKLRFQDPAFIQANTAEVAFISRNYMYASRIANPVAGDTSAATGRLGCDQWAGTVNTIPYYHTNELYGTTVAGCNRSYVLHRNYLSIGPNGTNNYYQKSLRFPYEVRQWSYSNGATVVVPASYGYTIDSVQVRFHRTAGLTYTYQDFSSVPFTYTNDTVRVNYQNLYAEFGGPATNPISDDGYLVDCYVFLSANCKTRIPASGIASSHEMLPYNGALPQNYLASYGLNAAYLASNPVQLVSGGGGTRNLTGKYFSYNNIVVSNQTLSPSNYGYIYFKTNSGTVLTDVKLGSTTLSADANGYYNIGGFSAGQIKNLSVSGSTTKCVPDTVLMYYGWSCNGFPSAPFNAASECYTPLRLIIRPLSAKIDGLVTPLASTPANPSLGPSGGLFGSNTADMCAPFPVEIVINSALQGNIYDILSNVQLPPGVEYVDGSAYFETPIGTAPVAVSAAQEATLSPVAAGGILPFDLELMSSGSIDSLQGTVGQPASIRQLKIRFLAKPTCAYNGKGRIRATLLAKRACGANALNNGTIKSGNTLRLTPPTGTFAVSVVPTISPINACGVASQGSVVFNKTDAAVPTNDDSIIITVPSTVDINNISCAACIPALAAPNVVDDGTTKTLSWVFPSGNVTGAFTINFDASAQQIATCSNPFEITAAVTQLKGLFCADLGGLCPGFTSIEAASGAALFNINLPSYSFSALAVNEHNNGGTSTYEVSGNITNSSSVNGTSYTLLYALDIDGDSLITTADIILDTVVVNTPIAAGATQPFTNLLANAPQSAGAELIVGIVAGSNDTVNTTCACGDAFTTALPITQPLASIGNRVWLDANGNGLQDAGEVGVSGVTVNLYQNGTDGLPGTADDIIIGTATTDANGFYLFDSLMPSFGTSTQYNVGFVPPATYLLSPSIGAGDNSNNTNSDAATIAGINAGEYRTGSYALSAGESDTTVDAGLYKTASIGNYVWNDLNGNGTQDAAEPGMAGVTVTLYNASGNPIATTITDATGAYQFSNLVPGNYSVGFTPPVDYTFTASNAAGDNGNNTNSDASNTPGSSFGTTPQFTLSSGENDTTADAGFITTVSQNVGNKVWLDDNKNGVQDANEIGVAGVTVTLFDAAGNVVATTVTNSIGEYLFVNVPPGIGYTIGFTAPVGAIFTTQETSATDTAGSNANPATGQTAPFNVIAGQDNLTIDAGIYLQDTSKASVGDKVWNDLNQDGIQDPGEPGIPGVTVYLLDNAGAIIDSTVTDAFGNYIFNNLTPGVYSLEFVTPAGYTGTLSNGALNDGNNSDATSGTTAPFTLAAGEINLNVDAGFYQSTPAGTLQLGDQVWYDNNSNGLQDPGEPGAAGVTVQLLDAATGAVIATTTTDLNGYYTFVNLAPGNYQVSFSNLPSGYVFTTADASGTPGDANSGTGGTDDSDAGASGITGVINLSANNLDVDAGIVKGTTENSTGSIGNTVWYDNDNDGIQDPGETGQAGITVVLLDAQGNVVDSAVTDALGNYIFTNLPAGDYTIEFSNLPAGFMGSPSSGGVNDALNSDGTLSAPGVYTTPTISLGLGENNSNVDFGVYAPLTNSLGNTVWYDADNDGVQDATEIGAPGITVTLYDNAGNPIATTVTNQNGNYMFNGLADGTYVVGFSNIPSGYTITPNGQGGDATLDGDANPLSGLTAPVTLTGGVTNLDIDAGIYNPNKGSISGTIWDDANADGVQDPSEVGTPGMVVTLKDGAGNTVGVAITDGNGNYSFTNLPFGDYTIEFTKPDGSVWSPASVVGTPADVNNDGSTGSAAVSITAGSPNSINNDAGHNIPQLASIGDKVWLDQNGNGTQDGTEPGVAGVLVTLYNSTGTPIGTAITDAEGQWQINDIPAGTGYYVEFSNLPKGAEFTATDAGGNDSTDSDADIVTGQTAPFDLSAGQHNGTLDAGLIVPAQIGSYVWNDVNNNGIYEAGEAPVPGVKLYILNSTGGVIDSVVTDATGLWIATVLPGTYSVMVDTTTLPSGFHISNTSGSDDGMNDAVRATATTTSVTVLAGEYNPSIWVGITGQYPLGTIDVQLSGITLNGNNKLTWQVSGNTQDIVAYQLYRSTNGSSSVAVHSCDVACNSFVDAALDAGNYQYFVVAIDKAGKLQQSNSVVLNIASTVDVVVYPNPTADVLHIAFNKATDDNTSVVITDAAGKIVLRTTLALGTSTAQISLAHLASAQYTISIESEGSKKQAVKFTKQ
jgi:protocatechuate 3,4-dioxygenase beta subunit